LQLKAKARNPSPIVPVRKLRADAKLNREKLLAAADAAFTELGAGASMDEIARRAGVGIGTLYRHFPSHQELLAATCDKRLLALAQKGLARATPGAAATALESFLEQLVVHAGTYRGLAASFGVVLQNGSPGCHATTEAGERLLKQAQIEGGIRRDVQFGDVVCMATAISLTASQDPSNARRIPRLVAMFVDGLRASK
jgi:AcrR family transcriptional regulator